MKKLILTFVIFFLFKIAFSQADFREGYYINNSNDTIKGLIDFRGYTYNAMKCRFKVNQKSDIQAFAPGEIKAYRLKDGKYYVSKHVNTAQQSTSYYLECLISGELTVYFLRDEYSKDYYFIEDRNGKLTELNNNEIVGTDAQGVKYSQKSSQYKKVLSIYFSKYPDLKKSVKTLPYSRKPIISIAKKYHEKACTNGGQCIEYEKQMHKNLIEIGITTTYSNYASEYGIVKLGLKRIIGHTKSMGIGIESQVQLSDLSEKAYFISRLTYHSMKMDGLDSYNFYTADVSDLKLNLGFKYAYQRYKIKPIILFGIYGERLKFSNYSNEYGYPVPESDKINSLFQTGFFAGLGLEYKAFKISAAYEINTNKGHAKYLYKTGLEYSFCYYFLRLNR